MEFDREELKKAVLDIYLWQYLSGDSFSSLLCHLIRKSDIINKAKLGICFPHHIEAMRLWEESADGGRGFFAEWGIEVDANQN